MQTFKTHQIYYVISYIKNQGNRKNTFYFWDEVSARLVTFWQEFSSIDLGFSATTQVE